MWLLRLNNMRAAQVEILSDVAVAETRRALDAWLDSERVEPYQDGPWGQTFRAGGPLEWYNPPQHEEHFIDLDAWASEAHRRIDAAVRNVLAHTYRVP